MKVVTANSADVSTHTIAKAVRNSGGENQALETSLREAVQATLSVQSNWQQAVKKKVKGQEVLSDISTKEDFRASDLENYNIDKFQVPLKKILLTYLRKYS